MTQSVVCCKAGYSFHQKLSFLSTFGVPVTCSLKKRSNNGKLNCKRQIENIIRKRTNKKISERDMTWPASVQSLNSFAYPDEDWYFTLMISLSRTLLILSQVAGLNMFLVQLVNKQMIV